MKRPLDSNLLIRSRRFVYQFNLSFYAGLCGFYAKVKTRNFSLVSKRNLFLDPFENYLLFLNSYKRLIIN